MKELLICVFFFQHFHCMQTTQNCSTVVSYSSEEQRQFVQRCVSLCVLKIQKGRVRSDLVCILGVLSTVLEMALL